LGAKPKQAGKKEGGCGCHDRGISAFDGEFARPLPFPFCLSKEKAKGVFFGGEFRHNRANTKSGQPRRRSETSPPRKKVSFAFFNLRAPYFFFYLLR